MSYNKLNERVRTPKMNAIFGSIPILQREISNIKNGEPIPVNQFSDLVTQSYRSSNFISRYILPVESKHKVWRNSDRKLLY